MLRCPETTPYIDRISVPDIADRIVRPQSFRYVKALEHDLLINAYDPLFNINQDPKWSSILNCQTFTRSAIEHLGFEFSEDVQIISDCISMVFDVYLNTCLMAARATERTNK